MSELIQRYEQQLAANPANHLARFSLGKALFDAERFREAQHQLAQALAAKPDWMLVQILIGKCQLASGDKPAARQSFEKGRDLAIAQNHEGPREEMEQLLAELED